MMKMKTIETMLDDQKVNYYRSEDNQHLIIAACHFSENNFFDYGEKFKEPCCDRKEKFWQDLFHDPRIIVKTCDWCNGCAGW